MINTDYYIAIMNHVVFRADMFRIIVTRQEVESVTKGNYLLSPTWTLLKKAKDHKWSFEKYALNLLTEWWGLNDLTDSLIDFIPDDYTPEISKLLDLKLQAEAVDLYLICFEKDKTQCHREIIKALLLGLSPAHILINIQQHDDHLILD